MHLSKCLSQACLTNSTFAVQAPGLQMTLIQVYQGPQRGESSPDFRFGKQLNREAYFLQLDHAFLPFEGL